MHSSRKPIVRLGAVLGLAALGLAALPAAQAQVTYTFTGTEGIESQRLFRDGTPSSFATPKTFPGTFAEADRFQTFTFANPLAMNTPFFVAVANPNLGTFYSVYDSFFNPANLAQNYLGDQGGSLNSAFSVLATPNENLILVLNTVGGTDVRSTSTFTTSFTTPPAVPEASTTVSLGLLLALGMGGMVVAARRKKASVRA